MRGMGLALMVLAVTACSDKAAQSGPPGGGMPPTRVDTVRVEAMPVSNRLQAVGNIRALESISIRPEVAGKLVAIQAVEGQSVAAGSVLFRLDDAIARADLNEALAAVKISERNRPRIIELLGKQLISRADADEALANSEIASAKYASAKARMDKTQIRAPFEGVVGLRQVSIGEFVTAGQALVELVRLDPIEVEFDVPESMAGRLHEGQSVTVSTDAFAGESFNGSVTAVAPSVSVSRRSITVRARLQNAEKKLKPGQFAQVTLALETSAPVLRVPEQAIWPNGNQKMVYRVKAGKVELVPVSLGVREPGWVEVKEGLVAGDEVVTAGQMKLFPGASVSTGQSAEPRK